MNVQQALLHMHASTCKTWAWHCQTLHRPWQRKPSPIAQMRLQSGSWSKHLLGADSLHTPAVPRYLHIRMHASIQAAKSHQQTEDKRHRNRTRVYIMCMYPPHHCHTAKLPLDSLHPCPEHSYLCRGPRSGIAAGPVDGGHSSPEGSFRHQNALAAPLAVAQHALFRAEHSGINHVACDNR